jgi:phenylacetate-CoA ligase
MAANTPPPASGIRVSVVMPALNEEKSIRDAVSGTLASFGRFGLAGEVLVVNDGSTDGTKGLVESLTRADGRVRMIEHASPLGVGASFWDGVDAAQGESVVMLPGDDENDPDEILRYAGLMEHVDIVVPYIFNRGMRPLWREAFSLLYRLIVNGTFRVNFNYTNGTVLYRRSVLQRLESRCGGFFFQTDILVRAVKKGYLFAEVPCRLKKRRGGKSKAVSWASFAKVVRGYLGLCWDYHAMGALKPSRSFAPGSLTALRRSRP